MKNKRIAIIVIVAVALACGGYFGLMSFRDTTPVLAEGFGILQPEVEIRNIYPGYVATIPFTILCGEDGDRTFAVTLQQPNLAKLRNGYKPFPEGNYSWLGVESSYQGGVWKWDRIQFDGEIDFGDPILVDAGHYRQLTILVTMPWELALNEVDWYDKETEVRVRVSELSATGFVQLAIESKWYIITASQEDMESS